MIISSKLFKFCETVVLAVAIALLGLPQAHAAGSDLRIIEQRYADFLDAHSAAETISSGVMTQVGGHDGAYWVRQRAKLVVTLNNYFKEIRDKNTATHEQRAIASMRRTFDELTAAGSDSSAPNAVCADARAKTQDVAALHASLYACFDSLGNNIEFEGQQLTRVAALQLLQEIPDSSRRKALFLAMQPLWQAINANDEAGSPYRRLIASAAPEFSAGRSAIHAAAASFGIDVPEAERWLIEVLESWREVNAATGGAAQLIEPWDYRFKYSLASRTLSAAISRDALLPLQARFYRDLGADTQALGVVFDIDPRPGKAPLAYADTIRIGRQIDGRWRPAIVRISANDDRGGLGILNELVHETGHAVHFMAIRARPAYFWPDITFCEAFADVTSWSVYTPAWQKRYLGTSVTRADGLREQYAGVMLDVAWSLFELRMLRAPDSDPNELWSDITQRYLGIVPHPELSWWAVRSQLVSDPGYMINYGLGALITAEIRARTVAAIGNFDAGNARWYDWTSANLLRFGAQVDITELLRRFLGHPVSPSALTRDIASIGEGRVSP